MKATIKNPPAAKKRSVPTFGDLGAGDVFAFTDQPTLPFMVLYDDHLSAVRLDNGHTVEGDDVTEDDEIIPLKQKTVATFEVDKNFGKTIY